jgi:ribonuclease HII
MELIAGMDEVGRGALAGPVVAAACILTVPLYRRRHPEKRWSPFRRRSSADCFIADSKQLTGTQRERTFVWISEHCPYGIGIASRDIIEEDGILAATELAMHLALAQLRMTVEPQILLVDGRDHFHFDLPFRSIIRGDQSEPCIAAASIVAKVTRDRLMSVYDEAYPSFLFKKHKGYGTAAHIARIQEYGPCPLHRDSFLSRILR